MKNTAHRRSRLTLITFACLALACSDSGTEPVVPRCEAETSSVEVSVEVGSSVVFDWTPACGVHFLIVEEGASDRWLIWSGDNPPPSTPDQGNIITPPVTYGIVPSGVVVDVAPIDLVPGTAYNLALARILPAGANVDGCFAVGGSFGGGTVCGIALHNFIR